jgi:membrane dipeptidase
VSEEACRLLLASDLVDLHLDTEVPVRLFGYDPLRRHRLLSRRGSPLFGHADFPRLISGGFSGVVWDIATNPLRRAGRRAEQTLRNIAAVIQRVERHPDRLRLVRTASEYREARSSGRLAVWLALQGGNAFAVRIEDLDRIPGDAVCRITLVHLTNSRLGATSSPLKLRPGGLTRYGRDFLQALQARRILVDLAHIHPRGFWDAVETADPAWPLIASHTGVTGVRPHWRNLDDHQLRALGRSGGLAGVIFNCNFLAPGLWSATSEHVLAHLAHIVAVAGEEAAALGTDYDGLILPPTDLPDPTFLPRLVERMLRRRWSAERIAKILGGNWLRVLAQVRP